MTNQRADEPMQILIGTPAYGDSVTTTYFDTVTWLLDHFREVGSDLDIVIRVSDDNEPIHLIAGIWSGV